MFSLVILDIVLCVMLLTDNSFKQVTELLIIHAVYGQRWKKYSDATVYKYSVTSKSPASKYPNQNIVKVPKVKTLVVQNGRFQNNLQAYYICKYNY